MWPLLANLCLKMSTALTLSPKGTVLLMVCIILSTSLDRDLTRQFWIKALSACRHRLEAVRFSKKQYFMMFLSLTLNLKPMVGSQPSVNSSLVSLVKLKHSVWPAILPLTPLLVLCVGESSESSLSHSLLYHKPPFSYRHPGLSGYMNTLVSSTHLPSSSI